MSYELDTPFWRWSVERYGRKSVEHFLLTLQDEYELDVNMLLWCSWMAHEDKHLLIEDIASAMNEISEWRTEVIAPLRNLRRRIKPLAESDHAAMQTRTQVQRAELEAEQYAQFLLYSVSYKLGSGGATGEPRDTALQNMTCYASTQLKQKMLPPLEKMLKDLSQNLFIVSDNPS